MTDSNFIEEPFFFHNKAGQRLFGVLHRRVVSKSQLLPATSIVYCHPLFEEKLHAHRIGVNFAREAARSGFDVLRFDYFGDGESEGLFQEASVETRIADILSAVEIIHQKTLNDKVALVGLRVGATFAIMSAVRSQDVNAVVAWSPILDLKSYLYEMLRSNISAQVATHKKVLENRDALVRRIEEGGQVNVDGYLVANAFYTEASAVDLRTEHPLLKVPILAISISSLANHKHELKHFSDINPQASVTILEVSESEFWTQQRIVYPACRELFARTLEWMSNHQCLDDNLTSIESFDGRTDYI